MIKRVVILQDEHLVIREIEHNMQRVAAMAVGAGAPAYAGVGAGVGLGGPLPFVPPPIEPEPLEALAGSGPVAEETGGSLASVAKAASIKAERAAIEQTLRQVHWNRRKAAQILGVSYKTLLNKIKECGISRA
jgi:DNA-binding NtrC family response regulator